jgi:hypothetical protein
MAADFTSCLEVAGIRISRDGRGRALDTVFIERLWRSLKFGPLEKGVEKGMHFR